MAFSIKWNKEIVSGTSLTEEQARVLLEAGIAPCHVGRSHGGSRHYDMRANGKDREANASQIAALKEGKLDASLLKGKAAALAAEVAKMLNVNVSVLKGPYLLCFLSGRMPSAAGWTGRSIHKGSDLDVKRLALADALHVEAFRTSEARVIAPKAAPEAPEAPAGKAKAGKAKPASKAPAEAAAVIAKARKPRRKAPEAPAPEAPAPEAPAPEVAPETVPTVPTDRTGTAGE